jgi:putative restriction endonuclease
MTSDEIRDRFRSLTVWKRGGERAPHKPLLALYAIGRTLRGEPRMAPYAEVDKDLGKLLVEFGPPRQSVHTEYPFWRLRNDGVWELTHTENVNVSRSADARKSDLLAHEVGGGFPAELQERLAKDPRLASEIVQDLLIANFPETLHQDILDAVGIEIAPGARAAAPRRLDFRERVLRAYEYRCAVCGFDVRLGTIPVALEAAHIKWHQAGGPDEEFNGLALCTLHHKLFDRGVFTLSGKLTIIVSESANGTKGFQEWVVAFHGEALRPRPTQNVEKSKSDCSLRFHFLVCCIARRGPGKPMIENIEWLSAEDRKKIFEDNARAVFKLAAL